jgi:pimeloyl-ACP methyl ester carboxylesterase
MGDAISSLLFQPPSPTYLHPSRHFWLTTKHGSSIPAFFIERPHATVTILFSHGNAEDLGMIYDWFNDLARVLKVNILAYDYTGYGKSSGGPPTEENCYADIEAAYQYLTEVRHIPPEQIVLYGRSLGSGPSCYLARKTADQGRSVSGVILQSPLLSAYRVAFNFRFTMCGDKFPNIDRAPFIRCPVFIIHGTQDEVVPFWHGQELFTQIPQEWRAKPFWVEGAGHNNIEALLRPTGTFIIKLLEFLDLHVGARRGQVRPPVRVPDCVPLVLREFEEYAITTGAINNNNNNSTTTAKSTRVR